MNTTIDQWEVLETVVQLGSFAAAAAKMNRSQSTISYAISRLQEEFKFPIFEMNGRRAQLTPAGKALLAHAEPLLDGFRALEQKAASFAAGGKTVVRLSVDSLYPDDRLFSALTGLSRFCPSAHPLVHKAPFVSSAHEFAACGADLCITALPERDQSAKPILDVRMRAVARADHALHKHGRELSRLDLLHHLAVIIEGTAGPEPKRQPYAKTQRIMTVNTIESAIEAVRSGMCFGWLPMYRIAPHLDSGELASLRLPLKGERMVRLFLILKSADPAGQEEALLADLFGAGRDLEVL